MKVLIKLFYLFLAVLWIGAPFLLTGLLDQRGLIMPDDIRIGMTLVWYAVPLIFFWWTDKDRGKTKPSQRGPSYTKDTDDWFRPGR